MRVVVFQPPYPKAGTTDDAGACLRWMQERLEGLRPGEQDLVLLPEYANAPGLNDRSRLRSFACSRGANFLEVVAASAKRLAGLIVLSGVARSGTRWFNRSMVFDRTGAVVSTYDKTHLTDAETVDLRLSPGARPTVFVHAGIRIGFATCFDLYFPEHFAALAALNAGLVLCPSYQWSESSERIRLVAQARALDGGVHLIRSSYSMGDSGAGGHSLVATPEGAVLVDGEEAPGIVSAQIDPKRGFVKPASHGRQPVEHRAFIESHRRPFVYRSYPERVRRLVSSAFPRLCAHRGLSLSCPENTLPAFAAACGAHEIELDVWTSRDGVPAVCHDETVDRTTNGKGRIADLGWDEIRSLDAGVRNGEARTGVHAPAPCAPDNGTTGGRDPHRAG